MYNWNHEASFDSYNQDEQPVRVSIYFNIERDDNEVMEFGTLIFKKCYEIDVVEYDVQLLDGTNGAYMPTQDDFKEWKGDIKKTLEKQFERLTA